MSNRIKCDTIGHRKGLIEITPGIHGKCINIETWSIHPDIDLSKRDIRDANFPDEGVTGNTEIELTAEQARSLIKMLQSALAET
ncbi:MAG: hypothetical protein KJO54_13200 [Gammaproteobacteria bacterium]|nr:hypothetical protein [Gammaproteobacteria bacterium]